MPECAKAYRFATEKDPPASLIETLCEGIAAVRRVRRQRDGAEATFRLCRRHADLLWSMGHVIVGPPGGELAYPPPIEPARAMDPT